MKDLFQCVMNRAQFFYFFVDVPFSYWKTGDLVIVTGHFECHEHSSLWEHCQGGGTPSWENLIDDPYQW